MTLRESRPPILRRFQVQSDTTLQLLHDILQVTMGWFDTHLHQFVVDDVQYGALDADSGPDVEDEREVTIADVVAVGDRMLYEYDFGDGWEHDVLVEKLLEPKPGATYPVVSPDVVRVRRRTWVGIWQYADFVRSTSDPEDPEHDKFLEWVGGAFDPDEFDAADVNAALGEIARGA